MPSIPSHCWFCAGRLAALVPADGEGLERREAFRAGKLPHPDKRTSYIGREEHLYYGTLGASFVLLIGKPGCPKTAFGNLLMCHSHSGRHQSLGNRRVLVRSWILWYFHCELTDCSELYFLRLLRMGSMLCCRCRCVGCGGEWATKETANGADMHRHKLIADRLCTAMGLAAVLRLKSQLRL